MRDRNPGQRTQRAVGLQLLRCGENISHISEKPIKCDARQGLGENIDWRLFVHEGRCMAAPANRVRATCGIKAARQALALQQ
jgi:hypothetical protein